MDNLFIPIIYSLLLLLMVVILYFCGKEMAKTGIVFSNAGWCAIITFTLNEGLRFGRGIDYNIYGKIYDTIVSYGTTNRDIVFESFIKLLDYLEIPYQGLIIIQSFLFIIAICKLLINYREYFAFALPLFVLFSLYTFENLIRWYMGLSFILIGISQLFEEKFFNYFLLCFIGCLFHIGLILIPPIVFGIYFIKNVVLNPYISIATYIICGLFLKSKVMLYFTNYINMLDFLSDRSQIYIHNAEQWLTAGALGKSGNAFDSIFTIIYLFVIVWYGYEIVNTHKTHKHIFVYNLFIVGFILKPLANQIELMMRYDFVFYCFGAVVSSLIFVDLLKKHYCLKNRYFVLAVVIIFHLNYFRHPWSNPSYQFQYVWDQDKQSYESMHRLWIYDKIKHVE